MFVRLQVMSRRPQVLLAKWVAAWRAASSQVEGASTEAEAEAWIARHKSQVEANAVLGQTFRRKRGTDG